jgi:hypothetical protein
MLTARNHPVNRQVAPPAEWLTAPLAGRGPAKTQPRPFPCWILGLLCAAGLLASMTAGRAQPVVSREYQIKAAYLYNFAKFVEWPSRCFTNNHAPLVIGVFGPNPFGEELQAIASKHQIDGRPIVIQPVATVAAAAGVHLLFFSAQDDDRVAGALSALKGASVLTVGESDQFAAAGGVINLVRDTNKVRFEINALAAEQQGLKISAQLLKLAKSVRREP